MGDQKLEFPRDLMWVYLNNQLLMMPEDKRRKAIEKIISNPNLEYPLAALFFISDVPEDLAKQALKNILEKDERCNYSAFGYNSAIWALIQKFLSDLPIYLKEDFCKSLLDENKFNKYDTLAECYDKMPNIKEELKRKLLEKMLKIVDPSETKRYISLKGLPDDLKRKAMEKMAESIPFVFLIEVSNPPEDLKERALALNHREWPVALVEISRIIDSFLKEWAVTGTQMHAFEVRRNVPVFRLDDWKVLDRTKGKKPEMVLLWGKGLNERHEGRDACVLLFKDVSHYDVGYAHRVPPDLKSVKEAHAFICRQNPKAFDGFIKEV